MPQEMPDVAALTVRELIHEALKTDELDAEVHITFRGSSPIPVTAVDHEEGIVRIHAGT